MKNAKEIFVLNNTNILRGFITLFFFSTTITVHAGRYWFGSAIGKEDEITAIFYSPAGIVLQILMFGFFAYALTRFFRSGVFTAKRIRKAIRERLQVLAVKDKRLDLAQTEKDIYEIIQKYFIAIDEGKWEDVKPYFTPEFYNTEIKNGRNKKDLIRFVSLRYATPSGLEYNIQNDVLHLSMEVFAGIFMKNTDEKMISGQRARMYQEHYYFFTLIFTNEGWIIKAKSQHGRGKIYSEDENKTVLQKIPTLKFPLAAAF